MGALPDSRLLLALACAFEYPKAGLAPTLAPLRAYAAAGCGAADPQLCAAVERTLSVAECFETQTDEQLAYTRLFIGSFRIEAPPYASYYLEPEHTMNGAVAAEVAAVYAQFGLELKGEEFLPADNLRYLLYFCGLLLQRHEETGSEEYADAYRDFRDAYLLSWLPSCCDLVQRYAEAPYYPALMELIAKALG